MAIISQLEPGAQPDGRMWQFGVTRPAAGQPPPHQGQGSRAPPNTQSAKERLTARTGLFSASRGEVFLVRWIREAGATQHKMKLLVSSRTITIPEGVTVEVKARSVRVKGPRGEHQS